MNPQTPGAVRWSLAAYRRLLVVYPPAHRRDYGPLMAQVFGDLCRDAYRRGGLAGLTGLWPRILSDLLRSVCAAHLEAAKEVWMAVNRAVTPLPWHEVALVVVPGVLFAGSRVYAPLGNWVTVSLVLVAILALVVLVSKRRIPAWSLLALGLLVNGALLVVAFWALGQLSARSVSQRLVHHLLVVVLPVWAAIVVLGWRHVRARRVPPLAWGLLALVVLSACAMMGYYAFTASARASALGEAVLGVLSLIGVALLPVALGLPLARRHGPLAALFVVGGFTMWLSDSDSISGGLLRGRAFYPLYAILLPLLFVAIAPLFLARARSWRAQAIGLLVPVGAMLVARVAVPWLVIPDAHPLLVRFGDLHLSVLALLTLALALVLYGQTDTLQTALPSTETDRPAYAV